MPVPAASALLRCLCSDDGAEFSASAPMPFELIEEAYVCSSAGRPPKSCRVAICSVAFAAEGARLLLFTQDGDLIAVGDGCVQQQLLSLHRNDQQQQQQISQQECWKKAAATVAPRFWADKSRRQRLRGACRLHVPHRKIVKVSSRSTSCCYCYFASCCCCCTSCCCCKVCCCSCRNS